MVSEGLYVCDWYTVHIAVSFIPNKTLFFIMLQLSKIVVTKQYLWEVLLVCFNWKKSADEAHWMLAKVYGDASTDKSSREWFRRFKNRDFSVEHNPRSGQQKFEHQELNTLFAKQPRQTR